MTNARFRPKLFLRAAQDRPGADCLDVKTQGSVACLSLEGVRKKPRASRIVVCLRCARVR